MRMPAFPLASRRVRCNQSRTVKYSNLPTKAKG
jgi:hypothetical protein